MRAKSFQQSNAGLATAGITSRFATASGLGATSGFRTTSGLAASGLAAGALGSAMGTQASQQAHARLTTLVAAGLGFAAASRLSRLATTTRVHRMATKQTGLRTRSADQTEQADRQQGGKDHTTLHWEGSSIQKHV